MMMTKKTKTNQLKINDKELLTGFFFYLYWFNLVQRYAQKPLTMKKLMILAAAGLTLLSCQKNEKKDAVSVGDTLEDTIPAADKQVFGKQCYLQVTRGKAEFGDHKVLSDSIIFNIEKQQGDSIWGIFHWKPAEKDKKIATYKGVLKGDKGIVIANSSAEGMNYKEEVMFTYSDSTIAIQYGEMTEGKDGIWRYKDQNKLNQQVLKKVDCK